MIELRYEPNDLIFKLTTSGFAHKAEEWLELQVEVTQGKNRFSQQGSWLEARDIWTIANWFNALSNKTLPKSAGLSFLEPNINFNYIATSERGVMISVELEAEFEMNFMAQQFHPGLFVDGKTFEDILKGGGYGPYDYENELIFEIKPEEFPTIIHSLKETGLKYPPYRNEDSPPMTEEILMDDIEE